MKKNQTKNIVYNGLLISIVVILASIPQLGFISIGPLSITIVHIPVIIAAVLFGYKSAILMGLVFGVSSMLVAISRAIGFDLLFINPLVSVVPRVLFAIVTVVIYQVLKPIKTDLVRVGLTAFLSSLIHSVMVFIAIYLTITLGYATEFLSLIEGGFLVFIITAMSAQVLAEAVFATVVSIPVVKALRKVID